MSMDLSLEEVTCRSFFVHMLPKITKFNDDTLEEGEEEAWFSIGMNKEEKLEARRPWRNNLIIRLS